MILGDTQESFRKTARLINHIRCQHKGGTPYRTLHDQTQKEGAELIDHLKQKADEINRNNFTAEGVCLNPEISRGGEPVSLPMDEIQKALSEVSTEYNPIELLNNPVIYEEPEETVNISLDDVTPKRQKDTRESPKVTSHDRKYVHDTICHIGFKDQKYVLREASIIDGNAARINDGTNMGVAAAPSDSMGFLRHFSGDIIEKGRPSSYRQSPSKA